MDLHECGALPYPKTSHQRECIMDHLGIPRDSRLNAEMMELLARTQPPAPLPPKKKVADRPDPTRRAHSQSSTNCSTGEGPPSSDEPHIVAEG